MPSDVLTDLPGNLAPQAVRDIVRILRESQREWGIHVARHTRARLVHRCRTIANGTAMGHGRQDVISLRSRLFLNEAPFVIVYNPDTRQVLRIMHQARNFPRLFR